MDEGITEIQNPQVLRNKKFAKWGSMVKIAKLFGGKKQYFEAVDELTDLIYAQDIPQNKQEADYV